MDLSQILYAQAAAPDPGIAGLVDSIARTKLSTILWFVAALTVVRLIIYVRVKGVPVHRRGTGFRFATGLSDLFDALVYAAILVFMLIRPFAIQTFHIPSGSMISTLMINDFIVTNKWVYRTSDPEFGDIAVFTPPPYALNPGQAPSDFIKRVVGVPGDVIEIRNKVLYRNGQAVEEPYATLTRYFLGPGQFVIIPRDEWDGITNVPDFKLVRNREGEIMPLQYAFGQANTRFFGTVEKYQLDVEEDFIEMVALIEQDPQPIPDGYYLMIGDNRNGSSDSRMWGLVPREDIVGRSSFIWLPFNRWGPTR